MINVNGAMVSSITVGKSLGKIDKEVFGKKTFLRVTLKING